MQSPTRIQIEYRIQSESERDRGGDSQVKGSLPAMIKTNVEERVKKKKRGKKETKF